MRPRILMLILELAETLVGKTISVSGSVYESTEGSIISTTTRQKEQK